MPTSLLDWITHLLEDPDARAAFQDDPAGYAARHGFDNLTSADMHDALILIADSGLASYDHTFATGPAASLAASSLPPPPPPHDYQPGEDAARYLSNYLATNFPSTEPPNGQPDADTGHGQLGDDDPVLDVDHDPVLDEDEGEILGLDDRGDGTGLTDEDPFDVEEYPASQDVLSFGSGDAARVEEAGFATDPTADQSELEYAHYEADPGDVLAEDAPTYSDSTAYDHSEADSPTEHPGSLDLPDAG